MDLENLDLNIDNYNLTDLLQLFNLDFNFNEDELKHAKKAVLMLHPDKSGLEKDFFLFFTAAYKIVYSVYNFRRTKTKSTEYFVEKDDPDQSTVYYTSNKFDDPLRIDNTFGNGVFHINDHTAWHEGYNKSNVTRYSLICGLLLKVKE